MTHLLDVLVNVPDTEATEDEASYLLTTDEGTMYYAHLMSQFEIVSGKTRLLTVEQAAAYGASLPDSQARFIELTEGFTLAAADWQQSRQHLPSPESPGYGAALVASAKADRAVLQALQALTDLVEENPTHQSPFVNISRSLEYGEPFWLPGRDEIEAGNWWIVTIAYT